MAIYGVEGVALRISWYVVVGTRIYRDMRRYTGIYEDIHRYYGMCEAHAHSDIPGYTKGYTSYSAIRG